MTQNQIRRKTSEADRRPALLTAAGLLLMAVGALQILYGIFTSLLSSFGSEDAPFSRLSVLTGIFQAIVAAGIFGRRLWARAIGLTLAGLGIGFALIGIAVHGLTVARDQGSGYLMLGFLASYTFIAVTLAIKGSHFERSELEW